MPLSRHAHLRAIVPLLLLAVIFAAMGLLEPFADPIRAAELRAKLRVGLKIVPRTAAAPPRTVPPPPVPRPRPAGREKR